MAYGRAKPRSQYSRPSLTLKLGEHFLAFLSEVSARHEGQKVQVVAHSMGGLITLVSLHRRPALFQSVLFAGVPFRGGIGFLPDLHTGVSQGLNKNILSPEVLATFPSVYTLFPDYVGDVVDRRGNAVPMDFFSSESWRKHRLGLFSSNHNIPPGFENFLPKALKRAKEFREALKRPAEFTYPPTVILCSKHFPTLHKAIYSPETEAWDLESASKAPGDGRVAADKCVPDSTMTYDMAWTEKEHAELLDDPNVAELLAHLSQKGI